jgi:hypothetical protein
MGRNGKQYVAVVAATNGQNNESLQVFVLPSTAPHRNAVLDLRQPLMVGRVCSNHRMAQTCETTTRVLSRSVAPRLAVATTE